MRNEDGLNAGVRNIGRFFLSLIPWALGVGFMAWLGVYVAIHTWRHEIRMEERAAIYVGAKEPPKSKLKIEVEPGGSKWGKGQAKCAVVNLVDIDGDQIIMHSANHCYRTDYWEWHWQQLSPDGTAITDQMTNLCPVPSLGGVAECKEHIDLDERAATVRVWVTAGF